MSVSDDAAAMTAAALTQAAVAMRAASPSIGDRVRGRESEYILQIYREMLSAVHNRGNATDVSGAG